MHSSRIYTHRGSGHLVCECVCVCVGGGVFLLVVVVGVSTYLLWGSEYLWWEGCLPRPHGQKPLGKHSLYATPLYTTPLLYHITSIPHPLPCEQNDGQVLKRCLHHTSYAVGNNLNCHPSSGSKTTTVMITITYEAMIRY